MSEFTHQLRFCQALGCKRDGGITARLLAKEAALIGIEAEFKHLVTKAPAASGV